MKELSIEEIHEGTLGILKKIIEICDEINVNYFLAYGSLIGAVRHGGFIPWDDDLDIVMLRPDYEIFNQYCLKHERELYPFKLINRKNEKSSAKFTRPKKGITKQAGEESHRQPG